MAIWNGCLIRRFKFNNSLTATVLYCVLGTVLFKMTNKERNLIKKKILKCLTEDFKGNQAIFDKKDGWQVFNGTDLDMVMNAVCKGLEMAKYEICEGVS